ncbi:MAG TPA: GvpL/GvpF family gas vesicle protein [Candidatus Hypogeohydataceae bacterium YC41]
MYLYVYGVIENELAYPPFPVGIKGTKLFPLKYGNITALVGDIRTSKIRPERQHLKLHEEVIKEFMKRGTILPVSFGTIAERMQIGRLMEHNYKSLRDCLSRYSGKVEMFLRLVWDVENIYKYFVENHPDLREEATSLFSEGMPSQWEKIELGKLFESLLKEEREKYTQKVQKALSAFCHESKELKVSGEKNILRLVCLIDKTGEERFCKGVEELAEGFSDTHSFEITGPWPLYNFCHVHLAAQERGRHYVLSR